MNGYWVFDSTRNSLLLILIGVLLGLVVSNSKTGIVVLLVGSIFTTIIAYYKNRNLIALLSIAYFTRIGLVLLNAHYGLLFEPPVAPQHHTNALMLIQAWPKGEFFHALADETLMWTVVAYLITPFYFLFDHTQTTGAVGIATYSLFVPLVTYFIARHVAIKREALLVTGIVAFWPSLLFRSIVLQREILMTGILLFVVLLCLRWLNRFAATDVLLLVVLLFLTFALRKENLVVISATILVTVLVRLRTKPKYVIFTGFLTLPLGIALSRYFHKLTDFGSKLSPQTLDEFAYARAHGDAVYLDGIHYTSWVDVIILVPVKVVYFLFSPLPWQIDGPTTLLAGISGWGVLIAALISRRGILTRPNVEKSIVLVAFLISGIVPYAIIEMNYGAAFRRRIQFIPILLLFGTLALIHAFDVTYSSKKPETEGLSTPEE